MTTLLYAERTVVFMMSVLIVGAILSSSDALSFKNNYELEVESDVNGVRRTPSSNSSTITIGDDLIGATVDLSCTSTNGSLAEYAVLEWMDGDVPIRESIANRMLEEGRNSLSLVLRNFTVDNYGQYHCRCVHDYSRLPRFSSRRHLNFRDFSSNEYSDTCSTGLNMVSLLPSGRLASAEETIVKRIIINVGDFHELPCESGNWVIWKSQSAPEYINHKPSLNITVRKSADQTKAVCLNSNDTLEKIFYVSIEGYHQLQPKFIRPSDGIQEVTFDLNSTSASILCLFQFENSRSFDNIYVSRNGGNKVLSGEISDGICTYSHPRGPLKSRYLGDVFVQQTIAANEAIASEWYNSTFSCSTEGIMWEEDVETTFTLARPDPVQEEASPTTTVALTSSPSPSEFTAVTTSPWLLPTATPSPWLPSTATPLPWLLPTSAQWLQSSTITPSPLLSATGLFTPSAPPSFPPTPSAAPSPPPGTDSNSFVLVSAGLGSLLVVSILLLCIVYICLKKCRCLANRYSMAGLTAKELFLEFGITENGSQEALSSQPSATNPLPYSKSLANCMHQLKEKQWLFPYEQLELGEELGSGAFGVVKKAQAHNVRPDGSSITVAVKMLKDNGSVEEKKDLVSELKVLQHVGAHPNIVSFLGAAINQGELHIIVEFCGKGNLLHYLRSKRGDREDPLTPKGLIAMAHQVSHGMKYLASKKCIHRDLAARNVLVGDDLVLKVADFGLARKVYDSIYRPSGGRVPIKWMAPETILDREYTTQSDVWSFGILLWEMMSLGRSPYPGKSHEEVIKCIRRDYRMPAPDRCPQSCYSLMLKCWEQIPRDRPSFAELCNLTEELGTQLEALEFRNYHILEERRLSYSGDFSSTLTAQDSELCCYCSAEMDGETKYCRCSRPSLLEGEGDTRVYENTSAAQVTRVRGSVGPDSPRSGKSQLQTLKGMRSTVVVSNGDRTAQLLNSTTYNHQSTSMPYLPIVWASTDYLPLMSSSHPHNATVKCEPNGSHYDTLPSKDLAKSQSHTPDRQSHGGSDGSHYDKLLSKKMAASQPQICQPHSPNSNQRHSLHNGSYCEGVDNTTSQHPHYLNSNPRQCLSTGNHYDRLLGKDSTTGTTSQHRHMFTKAKSLDLISNRNDGADIDSPLVITNHFSPAHELWSRGGETIHPYPERATAAKEKLKVEPQHSNTSDDSGVDFPNSFPDEQQMEKPLSYAPKMKIELRESNVSNDSGVETPMSFPEGQEEGNSNHAPIIEKMKVKPRQSTASNDSGMDTPTPSENPSNCVFVTEKMKVEHQPSDLSNDSGIVTLASDITSLLELWSQKSSLSSEAITIEFEEGALPFPLR